MSNLIITIITIALVAIAAISGIYYGGKAYQQGQINAAANAMMTEARQILAAERLWALNNNSPDFENLDNGTLYSDNVFEPDYCCDVGGAGMAALLQGKELSNWPPIAGTLAPPSPTTGDPLSGGYDYGCYSINGYQGPVLRSIFSYLGGNYVMYQFQPNIPYSAPCTNTNGAWSNFTTDTSEANHPIVLIAKAVNNTLNQIASNADTGTMPYVGIPRSPVGATGDQGGFNLAKNPDGSIVTNYCYLVAYYGVGNQYFLNCVFGPS